MPADLTLCGPVGAEQVHHNTTYSDFQVGDHAKVHNGHVFGDVTNSETHLHTHHHGQPQDNYTLACRTLFITDPEIDRASLNSTKGERVAGTCTWITNDPLFHSWLNGDLRVLWISGGPGQGKTMMSIYLSEILEAREKLDGSIKAFYYFCSHQEAGRNNALGILKALVWQLLRQSPDLFEHVSKYFDGQQRCDSTVASREVLLLVLKGLL